MASAGGRQQRIPGLSADERTAMSRNAYELEIRAACPVHDGLIDIYRVIVRSENIIPIEKIVAFFESFSAVKIYQEELTAKAATALGAQVELIGIHSGVTVRSVAP
jgi:hypothetical protein